MNAESESSKYHQKETQSSSHQQLCLPIGLGSSLDLKLKVSIVLMQAYNPFQIICDLRNYKLG